MVGMPRSSRRSCRRRPSCRRPASTPAGRRPADVRPTGRLVMLGSPANATAIAAPLADARRAYTAAPDRTHAAAASASPDGHVQRRMTSGAEPGSDLATRSRAPEAAGGRSMTISMACQRRAVRTGAGRPGRLHAKRWAAGVVTAVAVDALVMLPVDPWPPGAGQDETATPERLWWLMLAGLRSRAARRRSWQLARARGGLRATSSALMGAAADHRRAILSLGAPGSG